LNEDFVDVGQLVADCLALLRDTAARAQIELRVDRDPELPLLYADERKLKQIVINLLSNALKFTPAGGTVEVAAIAGPAGDLRLSVRDSGVGIRPEDIAKVFEPFGQVRGAAEHEQPGTGLGLPLSRKLAELHGGTLEIESATGHGTTVILSLPAERVRAAGIDLAARETAVA
ncbi:MAG TPA: ATP-binding protein, partial [Stellaceae bacterium]|nr:ATP-binding protein [Stellaceae bacterium]